MKKILTPLIFVLMFGVALGSHSVLAQEHGGTTVQEHGGTTVKEHGGSVVSDDAATLQDAARVLKQEGYAELAAKIEAIAKKKK